MEDKFWTIMRTDSDVQLKEAIEDRNSLLVCRCFIGVGESVTLKHLDIFDMPGRHADASFHGCNNNAWIITETEKDAYLELNRQREAEAEAARKADELAEAMRIVKAAEHSPRNANGSLMTAQEAYRWRVKYNEIHNDGGSGYIPDVITQDRYDAALKSVEESKKCKKFV